MQLFLLRDVLKFGRVGSVYHRRDGVLSGGQVTGGQAVLFEIPLVVFLSMEKLRGRNVRIYD